MGGGGLRAEKRSEMMSKLPYSDPTEDAARSRRTHCRGDNTVRTPRSAHITPPHCNSTPPQRIVTAHRHKSPNSKQQTATAHSHSTRSQYNIATRSHGHSTQSPVPVHSTLPVGSAARALLIPVPLRVALPESGRPRRRKGRAAPTIVAPSRPTHAGADLGRKRRLLGGVLLVLVGVPRNFRLKPAGPGTDTAFVSMEMIQHGKLLNY